MSVNHVHDKLIISFNFRPIQLDGDADWAPETDDEEEGVEEEQPSTSTSKKRAGEDGKDDGRRGRRARRGRGQVSGERGRGQGRGSEEESGVGRRNGSGQVNEEDCGPGRGRGRGRGGGRVLSGEPWQGPEVADVPPPQPVFRPARTPGPQLLGGAEYTILGLFQLFLPTSLLTTIVRNSNLYGMRSHPEQWRAITVEDMFSYLAMIIYMGLVPLKAVRDYWRRTELLSLPFPPSVISGRKFAAISRTLHLSSPTTDEANSSRAGTAAYDRLSKLKPMYEEVRAACKAHFHPRQHVSIDERMVKSKARINLRQFMPDKPTKWGYKLFVLADSSTGYTWDFYIYEGKGSPIVKGLSYDSVMNLMDVKVLGQGYKLFVDNFYTSPDLFLDLLKKKVWACGTVREQRIGYPRDRPGGLDRRSPRGTIRWIREGPLLFVKWRDTKDVSILSTIHVAHSDASVQRGGRQEGEWRVRTIPAPPAVIAYNSYMGGVDRSDALISFYNIVHKTRKWWRTLFFHFVDIAVVNAFILHKELATERQEVPLTQKEFREALVQELKAKGSPSTAPPMAPPPAPPGVHHMPRHFTPDGTTGRRQCVHCRMRTTVECTSCGVALCFMVTRDCYTEWHALNVNM